MHIKNSGGKRLPRIFVFVSELEELMQAVDQNVKRKMKSILSMGRVGIHVIMASTNPDISVFRGSFRGYETDCISFKMPSTIESCTVLGEPGAEKLIGNGDMLFYSRARNKTVRIQGIFVSDDEIIRVMDFLKNA